MGTRNAVWWLEDAFRECIATSTAAGCVASRFTAGTAQRAVVPSHKSLRWFCTAQSHDVATPSALAALRISRPAASACAVSTTEELRSATEKLRSAALRA